MSQTTAPAGMGGSLMPGRYLATALVATAGVVVSVALYLFVAHSDARDTEANFVNLARLQQAAIQSGIDGYEAAALALASYLENGREVSFKQFLAFSDDLRSRYPGISAFAWQPRVTRDERAAFEARARASVAPNFHITDNALNGPPKPAGDREVYYPLLYGTIEPGNEAVIGFDAYSDPRRTPVFQATLDSGKAHAVGPVPLITVGGVPAIGFVVFVPAYRWDRPHTTVEERRANIAGFVTGVFRINEMLTGILNTPRSAGQLKMYFYNPGRPAGDRLLYWRDASRPGAAPPTEAALRAGSHFEASLRIVDRELGVIFAPGPDLAGGAPDWTALGTLVGGLVMTAMLAYYLMATTNRSLRIAALAANLQETTQKLRSEADQRHAADEQLARRDAILDAVAASATDLLDQDNLVQAIPIVLERSGIAARVGHAYLLGDRHTEDGKLVARERYEWHAFDVPAQFKKPIAPHLDVRASGLIRWAIQLGDGHPISALVKTMPQAERTILEPTGLRSIMVMPIAVDGQWWGEIGLGDFSAEHFWSAAETDALRTLAELIGTAISRGRSIKALADANMIVENSPTILYRVAGEPSLPMIYISHNIVRFGYEPAQFIAWPGFYRTLVHPDDQEKVQAAMTRAMDKDTQGSSIECRLRTGAGAYRWVDNRFTPVRDANGRLVEMEGIIVDITERKAAEEKIALLARTDALTGLSNRATFVERLRQAFAAAKRGASAFSVLYLDLDHFKDINDTLGHPAGDLLLKSAAERLLASVRETDVVARLGGDEFAVLQADVTDPSQAAALATKLREGLAAPYIVKGNQLHVTASIGVAPYLDETPGPDEMLAQADLALYRAKEEGRDQYRFHSDELDDQVHERVAMADDLRRGLERGELELYYQPQVELASGKIVGMEALVRWNHPTRGLLVPGAFLGIAERTGSMVALGHWVLDGACRQMKLWREAGIAPPVVAANVSLLQLKAGRAFVHDVMDTLTKYGLSPGDLELDVTEFTLAQATLAQNEALGELRERGVRIALDDFGTEYSSFDYLRTYRVNHLKIARSFIERAVQDRDHAATIRAIIVLARELGIDVIAEGIETEEQRALLVKIGSKTEGQGFYFSKPLPADEAAKILESGNLRRAEAAA